MDLFLKTGDLSGMNRGGENSTVWVMMNIFRGFDCGSALRDRNTHNQRIERLWGYRWHGLTVMMSNIWRVRVSLMLIMKCICGPSITATFQRSTWWNNHGLRTERHKSIVDSCERMTPPAELSISCHAGHLWSLYCCCWCWCCCCWFPWGYQSRTETRLARENQCSCPSVLPGLVQR